MQRTPLTLVLPSTRSPRPFSRKPKVPLPPACSAKSSQVQVSPYSPSSRLALYSPARRARGSSWPVYRTAAGVRPAASPLRAWAGVCRSVLVRLSPHRLYRSDLGIDMTEIVIVLNSEEAVKAFSRGGNVTLGGTVSVAAGPIGTGGAVNGSLVNPAPMFSYSRSKGLFAGLALDGTALIERKDANREFYGSNVSATDILTLVLRLLTRSEVESGRTRS